MINNSENEDLWETIRTLNPEMLHYIDMDQLYGYLNKYKLFSGNEMEQLRLPVKAPYQRKQDLLDFMENKSPEGVENFVKVLYNTAHIEEHYELITLLQKKGVHVGLTTTV